MITAVDTNVLIVFKADETFGTRSADVLRQCLTFECVRSEHEAPPPRALAFIAPIAAAVG